MSDATIYNKLQRRLLKKYALGSAIESNGLYDGSDISELPINLDVSVLLQASMGSQTPIMYTPISHDTEAVSALPSIPTYDNTVKEEDDYSLKFLSMLEDMQRYQAATRIAQASADTSNSSILLNGVSTNGGTNTPAASQNQETAGTSSNLANNATAGSPDWDAQAAAKFLQTHKFAPHSCAASVALAVKQGGLDRFHCSENGGDGWAPSLHYAGILKNHGWTLIDEGVMDGWKDNHHVQLQVGDICVLGNSLDDKRNAHACLYDGERWQSNYHQNHMAAYGTHGLVKFFIYRHTKSMGSGGTITLQSTLSTNTQLQSVTKNTPSNLVLPEKLRTIVINKTRHTLSVGGIFSVNCSISRYGLGDKGFNSNTTPEGTFKISSRVKKDVENGCEAYYDKDLKISRPHAFGGRMFLLSGTAKSGSIDKRGIAIHGSDEYNDPDNYAKDSKKYGTHGCIALKNSDLDTLENIFNANGGFSNFKVVIEH